MNTDSRTTYRYGAPDRKVLPGTAPAGLVQLAPPLESPEAARASAHGVLVYSRPLTKAEIEQHDLVPIPDAAQLAGMAAGAARRIQQVCRAEFLEHAPMDDAFMIAVVELALQRDYPRGVVFTNLLAFSQQVLTLVQGTVPRVLH